MHGRVRRYRVSYCFVDYWNDASWLGDLIPVGLIWDGWDGWDLTWVGHFYVWSMSDICLRYLWESYFRIVIICMNS